MVSVIVILLMVSAYMAGIDYGENQKTKSNSLINSKEEIKNEANKDAYTIEEIESIYGDDPYILDPIKQYFGKTIQDVVLINQYGEETTLFEEFKDMDFIMEIMNTTCPVCERTVPNVAQFVSDNTIPYVLISAYDTLEAMQELIDKNNASNVKFYIAKDPDVFYEKYDLSFVPASFYVDKNKTTKMIIAGDATVERIKETVKRSFDAYE